MLKYIITLYISQVKSVFSNPDGFQPYRLSYKCLSAITIISMRFLHTLNEVFRNAFSGIWWAVSTLLTVGYGDIYPITPMGQLLSIFYLVWFQNQAYNEYNP